MIPVELVEEMKQSRTVKLVIFDLDGTLIDSTSDIADAVNAMLSAKALPQLTDERINALLGQGARRLVERAVPDREKVDIEACLADFRQRYLENVLVKTRPYPGIPELLDDLRPCPLALATNKPERHTDQILAGLGWKSIFNPVIAGDTLSERKPHRMVIETVCRTVGVAPEVAVLVGDSEVDVRAALNAGAIPVSVTWGFRSRAQLETAGALCFADSATALGNVLSDLVSIT